MGKSKLGVYGVYSALAAASLLSMGGPIPIVSFYERSLLKSNRRTSREQAEKRANRNNPDYKKKGVYPKRMRKRTS